MSKAITNNSEASPEVARELTEAELDAVGGGHDKHEAGGENVALRPARGS